MAEEKRTTSTGDTFESAREYEELEKPQGPHPVQDPVEAEHMAHAMDPHYEQASKIDKLFADSYEIEKHESRREEAESIPEEEYQHGDAATRAASEDEAESGVERSIAVDDKRGALEDAGTAARKAGDFAGELASKVYRRKKKKATDET